MRRMLAPLSCCGGKHHRRALGALLCNKHPTIAPNSRAYCCHSAQIVSPHLLLLLSTEPKVSPQAQPGPESSVEASEEHRPLLEAAKVALGSAAAAAGGGRQVSTAPAAASQQQQVASAPARVSSRDPRLAMPAAAPAAAAVKVEEGAEAEEEEECSHCGLHAWGAVVWNTARGQLLCWSCVSYAHQHAGQLPPVQPWHRLQPRRCLECGAERPQKTAGWRKGCWRPHPATGAVWLCAECH